MIELKVSGFEGIIERLAGIEERLQHPEPALEIVADLLEVHVARTFASQGAWAGSPWPGLKESTAHLRQRRLAYYRRAPTGGAGASSPILVWTGRLRDSFRRGSPGHVREISTTGLRWGSRIPYGIYHQSTAPRTRLPRRPMLAFRDAFQYRELIVQPLRLWAQGVPAGAIRTVMLARTGGRIG